MQKAADRYEQTAQAESQAGQLELEDEQIAEYNALKEKASQATVQQRQELEKILRDQTAALESRDRARAKAGDLQGRRTQLEQERWALVFCRV